MWIQSREINGIKRVYLVLVSNLLAQSIWEGRTFFECYQQWVDAGFCDGFVDRTHTMALQSVAPKL